MDRLRPPPATPKPSDPTHIEIRRQHDDKSPEQTTEGHPLQPPYDDPLHYMEAVLSGQIEERNDMSSLKNNILVAEILDAARQSAQTGKTIALPLAP